MSYIIDKLFLMAITFVLAISNGTDKNTLIAMLVTVIAFGLGSYFEKRVYVGIITAIYGILTFFIPELGIMLPVIIYDVFRIRMLIPAVLYIICEINAFTGWNVYNIIVNLILVVMAYYMYCRSNSLTKLKSDIRQIRDDEEERNILLAEKNKSLIEKQDQEVYVATLKERNRIAREIHDNVGHILTRTILQMGALMTIYKDEPLNGQLRLVRENLDIAMNNVRESVHDLHDESVDLKQAIDDIAGGLKGNFNYAIDYDIQDGMDRRYKYAIIGIVREAVSNIMKHSGNTDVSIVLREHPGIYQIIIHDYSRYNAGKKSDNRDMFEYLSKESSGIGLQNIEDRVTGLNGHLTISVDNGFKVFVTLPKKGE